MSIVKYINSQIIYKTKNDYKYENSYDAAQSRRRTNSKEET
jgi:hypothetical protein